MFAERAPHDIVVVITPSRDRVRDQRVRDVVDEFFGASEYARVRVPEVTLHYVLCRDWTLLGGLGRIDEKQQDELRALLTNAGIPYQEWLSIELSILVRTGDLDRARALVAASFPATLQKIAR